MTERAQLKNTKGSWADSIASVNSMIDDLVRPTIEVSRVLDAVADGDLSQKMSLKIEGQPVRGEFLRIGTTVNTMLDQLSSFASEVTRVAREVGTEGILGGQARVKGVSGIWRDLTDNVNFMANNLTTQVRNIADVTTAVANGDLSKKITVDVKGEVLELKNTINTMVDQLSLVRRRGHTRRARGRHRRKARRPGDGEGRQRNVEGPDGQRQLHGDEPDDPGARDREGRHRRRGRQPEPEVHDRGEGRGRCPRRHDQLDDRHAARLRRAGDDGGPPGRHRREARRPGRGAWSLRHLEGAHRQRQRHGREPHRPGAEHRGRDDRGREGRPLAQDHRGREGRGSPPQEHDQHHGRPALVVRRRGDTRREGGRQRRTPRRTGRGEGHQRHVARADGQREPARRQPHESSAEHRRRDNRGREGRPVAQDHRRCPRRDPRAEEHDQHDGRPALVVRRRGHPRRARGRYRGNPRRRGRGARRVGHLEGTHRQRELHGRQPHHAGAEHRRGHDSGRDRRPLEEDHRRRQGRDPRAQEHDQHHGRPALVVRRRGHPRRARSGHRGPARRPGAGQGRQRDVEGPHART